MANFHLSAVYQKLAGSSCILWHQGKLSVPYVPRGSDVR